MKVFRADNTRTVLSLCDYSGNWPRPYAEAGCTVVCLDKKHGDDLLAAPAADFAEAIAVEIGEYQVRVILAAPLCTAFTNSSALHWETHAENGTTVECVTLANRCVGFVEYFKPAVWALENPRGRIEQLVPRLAGKCRFEFHPYEYAGWLPDATTNVTVESPAMDVLASNRYHKQTRIWGECVVPERRPLEPIIYRTKTGKQGGVIWARFGGKSERTKEIRSRTPMGFARAFQSANGCG